MPDGRRVLRFDGVQRAAHWLSALLFGILIVTALPLYFASVESLVGRHVLVLRIHVAAGIALPFPLVVSLLGPWGARMRADLGRFNRWSEPELRWLRALGTTRMPRVDKFNPGQKLFAVFVGGSIAVMFGTGVVMTWFDLFPVSWRVGATVVHEVLAWLVSLAILGHIAMVVTHPGSMGSMLNGRVSESWARRHCPRWLEDQLDLPAVAGREVPGEDGAAHGVSWRIADRSQNVRADSSTTNSRSGRSGTPNRSSP